MKLIEELQKYLQEAKAKPDFMDVDKDGDKTEPFKKAVKDKEVDEAAKPDYLDMDGDGDKKEPMKKAVKDKELEEANVTGNLDGGEGPVKTPHAFGKSEDENDNAEVFDYKKSKSSEKHFESMYKKMISTMEDLHEISYRDYKKDPTSTPQQKVNRGIMEVNKMLGEMEKIVNNNLRLKTEMGVQSGHFWKATGRRFAKINERMLRVANRLKELSQ
tara:strand:- start:7670 stop:8317 length:648 start_codon:yes stop_codon:yes gene_type:complete